MIGLTAAEVAGAVGGRLAEGTDPALVVSGEAFADSRAAEPGGLFACVVGDRVDGHDYTADAFARGAVLALASRPVSEPAVLVDDVVSALGRLATHVLRGRPDITVVAVTGSSGKTSTKDLIAQVAQRAGPTVAPAGSYNTEIGLPLTVLRTTDATAVLVLEMGARGIGHIAALTRIATPRIGVVLNVGSAHLGEFGSVEVIANAKAELVESLPSDGVAILNADDPRVAAMGSRSAAPVVSFGRGAEADVHASRVTMTHGARASFDLHTPEGEARVQLSLVGEHHVANALAAAAVGRALGLSVTAVAEELSSARPISRWRMEVVERPDGVTVINDAYNANPESMRAALAALVSLAGDRRSWAVLGEMRELGAVHDSEHRALGQEALRLGVSHLVVVGAGARPMLEGAGLEGSANAPLFVAGAEEAIDLLRREVKAGDVVLLKASRALALERVATALLDDPTGGDDA